MRINKETKYSGSGLICGIREQITMWDSDSQLLSNRLTQVLYGVKFPSGIARERNHSPGVVLSLHSPRADRKSVRIAVSSYISIMMCTW